MAIIFIFLFFVSSFLRFFVLFSSVQAGAIAGVASAVVSNPADVTCRIRIAHTLFPAYRNDAVILYSLIYIYIYIVYMPLYNSLYILYNIYNIVQYNM